MKVMTIVGTRPELIRLSRLIHRLDATEEVQHVFVHTGQNYDYELNQVFFEDLDLRTPDHMLGVNTSSLGKVLGGTLIAAEKVMLEERPDAVLILGDTNSSIAALMARRMQIPVYHMEAGNRCFDLNVPEETNRRLVDHISDFNLVYTEHARRNLLGEGIHPRRILKTGSPMRKVLEHNLPQIQESEIHKRLGLEPGEYFIASVHREENVDSPTRMANLLDVFGRLTRDYGLPMYISTHPRTKKRLNDSQTHPTNGYLQFGPPLGYHDYNKLQMDARCALSDSGTISEESSILGFPAVTLRDAIERPEALDSGTILMTGLEPRNIIQAVQAAVSANRGSPDMPEDYDIPNFSHRVVNFLLSTVHLHHEWAGIRRPHADERSAT